MVSIKNNDNQLIVGEFVREVVLQNRTVFAVATTEAELTDELVAEAVRERFRNATVRSIGDAYVYQVQDIEVLEDRRKIGRRNIVLAHMVDGSRVHLAVPEGIEVTFEGLSELIAGMGLGELDSYGT